MVLIRNSWNWPEILIERAERFPVCWYFLIKMDELSQTYQTFCWHSLSFDPPASSLSASHFTSVIRMEEESVGAVSHSLVILMAAQSSFRPVSPSAFLVPFPVLHCYSGKLCAARKLFVFNKRSIVVFVAKTMLVAHWLAFSWHPTFIMSFPPLLRAAAALKIPGHYSEPRRRNFLMLHPGLVPPPARRSHLQSGFS